MTKTVSEELQLGTNKGVGAGDYRVKENKRKYEKRK